MAAVARVFLLPVMALLFGLLVLGYSAMLYDENRTVEQDGLQAPVQSIDKIKKFKRSGDHITFHADVAFTSRDGRAITARAALSEDALVRFRGGQPTFVRYLPDRPQIVRIVGEEDAGSSWLLVLFGCGALAYAGFGLWRSSRRRN